MRVLPGYQIKKTFKHQEKHHNNVRLSFGTTIHYTPCNNES